MPKISFNAQALGIASYHSCGNVSHAGEPYAAYPVMCTDTSIQALFERLGFANVERFPVSRNQLPAQDINP